MSRNKDFPHNRGYIFSANSTTRKYDSEHEPPSDSMDEACDAFETLSVSADIYDMQIRTKNRRSCRTSKRKTTASKQNNEDEVVSKKVGDYKYPKVVELSYMVNNNVGNSGVESVGTYQGNRSYDFCVKNTPQTTPSDRIHSSDWSTFDPYKLKNISETKVNNIITESLFQSSPEKTKNTIDCIQHSEDEEIIMGPTDSPQVVENNNTSTKNTTSTYKKMTFIRRFLSKFELKYDKTKKIKEEGNVGAPKNKEKCNNPSIVNKNIQCSSSKVFASQNQLNNAYIVYENSGSPQQVSDNEKENCLHNRMSGKRCLETDEWNDKTSSIISSSKFKTPKLTPYQKKVYDENCAPKFSPASRYIPDSPYGKILAVYKGDTLSIVSSIGTIALHSTAPGIYDLKPIAHSTPFQTPTHSLAKGRNGNKCRGTILPFEEKDKISDNTTYSKGKFSLNSNNSHVPSLTAPSYLTHIPEEMYVRKLTTIKNSIRKTKRIVYESEKIISDCIKKSNYNGKDVELTANRTKLIGVSRIESLKDEYQKTKILMNIANLIPRINSKFLSIYTINEIKLELNRLFCFKKTQENLSYVFFIVFKSANNVIGTQMKTVEDLGSVRLRQIKFFDVIRFSKLPINFVVLLEIYAMKIGELDRTKLSRFKKSVKDFAVSIFRPSSKKSTLISINENNTVNPNDSLHPKNQIGFEHFTQCGVLRLNRDTIGNQKFYLEEAKFPLEGTISLNTECSSLPQQIEVAYSGFLSIYNGDDTKGYSIKMWTIVKRSIMKFWKSCEDEYGGQSPVSIIDMSKITSPQLERIKASEFGYKEDSFCIDVICESLDLNCVYQHKRIFLSSECSNDCENWLQYLNGILKLIRHEPDSTS
uniref:Anillin domain-containing protein n=1 Tax=Strongyloides papillosus TaxID=174720 RepID=A0A0N5C113_STREA